MSETAIQPDVGPLLYRTSVLVVHTVCQVMAGPHRWVPAADGGGGKSWLDTGLLTGKITTKTDIDPYYLGNPLASNKRILGYETYKGAYVPQVEGEYEL